MTESFLRSDLPSMRNQEGAGGESLQGGRFLAAVGSRNPLCVPVRRLPGAPFAAPADDLSINP
jgi:hypothetical protein